MDQTLDQTDLVVAKTYEFPVEMEALKEVLPGDTQGRVNNPRLKLTPMSKAEVLKQDSILASHWLNLPLKEGAILVPYLYQQIRAIVDSYQLEHDDAFYEQYSELLVLKTGESVPTTTELRVNHKRFDKRLAHKLFHYMNAAYMYAGSLANLCILANVNGQGKFKSFGLSCKIGYINTASNKFEEFPMPLGSLAHIAEYSKFAVGKTQFGATFVSVPMWITDIFGNRGQHSFNINDLIASFAETGDAVYALNKSDRDAQRLQMLKMNAYNVAKFYGYSASNSSDKHTAYVSQLLDASGNKNAVPSMPHVDNGASLYIKDSNGQVINIPLNDDGSKMYYGFSYVKKSDGTSGSLTTDNIISRAWDNFNFWQTYMVTYFSDFSQENSQVKAFFTKVLKVLEPSMPSSKFFNSINTGSFFDAADLRNHMIFKKDNAVNSATIIKWSPILDNDGQSWVGSYFDENFNRYPVDEFNESDYLAETEMWPRLTPTIFHQADGDSNGAHKPVVFNTIASPGVDFDGSIFDTEDQTFASARSPVGEYASLLDLASSASLDISNTKVDVVAIDPDKAKEFVKAGNGIVFKSRPTSPMLYEQPLIDVTDPLQCGFNLIISDEAETPDEFSSWFEDSTKYVVDSADDDPVDCFSVPTGFGDGSESDPFMPTQPYAAILEDGANKYLIKAQAMSEYYRSYSKHILVFLGDNIFSHPAVAGGRVTAGNPNAAIFISGASGAAAGVAFIQDVKTKLAGITSATIKDDSVSDADTAVLNSIIRAAFPWIDTTDMKGISSPVDQVKRMIDLVQSVDSSNTEVVNEMRTYLIDPAYGPVAPVTYSLPGIDFIPVSPLLGIASVDKSKRVRMPNSNAAPASPKVAYKNTGANSTSKYDPISANLRPDWSPMDTASTFWLWFIDSCQFTKVTKVGASEMLFDNPVKITGFSSLAKSMLAMVSRSTVFFTGVEDTLPLYNLPSGKLSSKAVNVSASGTIKYSPLVLTPRTLVSKEQIRGKSPDAKSPSAVTTAQGQALSAGAVMKRGGSNDGKDVSKRGSARNNRRRPNKGKSDCGDGNKSSMYDASTKVEDEKFSKSSGNKEANDQTKIMTDA